MELAVHVEGNINCTWPIWKQHVQNTEQLGFAGLFRSDHLTVPEDAYPDVLEMVVSLAYAADHTERIHFGTLVSPLSFRHPVLLAFQAAAIDDLSGGRMILGLGTGWLEREHTMFGFELGDVPTRLSRLEEGVEVIRRLLRSEQPVSFSGRFYQLQEAALRPLPQRPGGPRILIGGRGIRRTLPLVARYADIWNVYQITSEEFGERSRRLNELLHEAGRQPGDVKRTFLIPVICGRTEADLARSSAWYRDMMADGQNLSTHEVIDRLRAEMSAMVGTPDQVVEQMQAYAEVGCEEIMMQLYDVDDFEMVQLIAEEVLPHVRS